MRQTITWITDRFPKKEGQYLCVTHNNMWFICEYGDGDWNVHRNKDGTWWKEATLTHAIARWANVKGIKGA